MGICGCWNNSGRCSTGASGRDGAGRDDLAFVEDPEEGTGAGRARVEPGAAGVFAGVQPAEHCAEGAASGGDDLYCGAFFIQTITHPGTLAVQVAHTEDSAQAIFSIVRRFWQNLPARMRRGALRTSRSNVRQLVFPGLDSEYRVETADDNAGRGMTIRYLHCSEVSRWPHGGLETLAALRAAVVPDGEIVLESTPNGAAGIFYEEWQKAEETGYTRHFFPWWFDKTYREDVRRSRVLPFTDEELDLVGKHGLTAKQIAWRRKTWKTMRGLARQEYAEERYRAFLRRASACLTWRRLRRRRRTRHSLCRCRKTESC